MRTLTVLLLYLVSLGQLSGEDRVREGAPKPCFLHHCGKGPDWIAQVSMQFQLAHLDRVQPFLDETVFDPSPTALDWTERHDDVLIEEISVVNGRKVVRIDVGRCSQGALGAALHVVMLAIETNEGSSWYSPFFVANPEFVKGRFISGPALRFGYVVTLSMSGTGAFRSHYLFDMLADHPALVRIVHAGRVRRDEFDNDEQYAEALKTLDDEERILKGEPRATDNPDDAQRLREDH